VNPQYEAFAHFDICIDHLGNAWNTLKAIQQHGDHPLFGPAFRFALIEYSMPYTASEGIENPRHRLDTKYVPEQFLELHNRILSSRHKVQAHADLSILEPTISWSVVDGQCFIARVQNNVSGLEEIEHLESILKLIEGTLDQMFVAREELVRELEP
jgi:hypothetical protein